MNIYFIFMENLKSLGIWELIHAPNFKGIEFEDFKKEVGLNSFTLAPQKKSKANGEFTKYLVCSIITT